MQPIYLDNAASTRVSDEVVALMTEVMRTAWGNAAAAPPQGAAARGHIETARTRLLAALGDRGKDGALGTIVWTRGCSAANALAVLGAARTHEGSIVISPLEHPAITTLAARHAAEGRRVVRVPPGPGGALAPDEMAAAAKGAGVVAFLGVQNEIGVVQPVAAIAQAVRAAAPGAHIHLAAAQALGKITLDVGQLGVDSISIAGHKLHGPKGAGARSEPLWVGGGQQHGMRGGTQDAPGAAGLGLAAERAAKALPTARAMWLEHAARVTQTLEARGIAFRQLVPDQRRSPHILALGIAGVPAGALRNVLASRGVYISTGSACSSEGVKASPTLAAIGLPEDHGTFRLSFALDTTADEVTRAAEILADVASSLRKAPRQ